MDYCPHCGAHVGGEEPVPPEPPIGTTVRDRHGDLITRAKDGYWGESGMVPLASWEPMFRAHGPLVVLEPRIPG